MNLNMNYSDQQTFFQPVVKYNFDQDQNQIDFTKQSFDIDQPLGFSLVIIGAPYNNMLGKFPLCLP